MWQLYVIIFVIICLVLGYIWYTYFYSSNEGKKGKKSKKSPKENFRNSSDDETVESDDETEEVDEEENEPGSKKKSKKVIENIFRQVHGMFCKNEADVGNFIKIAGNMCDEADFINLKALYDIKMNMGQPVESISIMDYANVLS